MPLLAASSTMQPVLGPILVSSLISRRVMISSAKLYSVASINDCAILTAAFAAKTPASSSV